VTERPVSIDALQALVATTSPASLSVAGAGTKRTAAAAAGTGGIHVLDLRGITGIVGYDPAECVVTVRTGTPVAEVADTLAAHGQYLPWDPPLVHDGATIGGMLASGLSGPGRYRYGGVRDFVIGAKVVDGRGRLIASGGQVVKNAAGFLLHHALAGSAGRLGVIAETSFKVFPRPEATCTLVARASSRGEALAAHERLRLANLDLDALDLDVTGATVLARLAGAADVLPARAERAVLALDLPADLRSGHDEAAAWATAARFSAGPDEVVVKVPSTPSRLAALLDALTPFGACRASVGGAVIYLTSARDVDDIEAALRGSGAVGAVVRGAAHGRRLGAGVATAFHDRVRQALDPDLRFR